MAISRFLGGIGSLFNKIDKNEYSGDEELRRVRKNCRHSGDTACWEFKASYVIRYTESHWSKEIPILTTAIVFRKILETAPIFPLS